MQEERQAEKPLREGLRALSEEAITATRISKAVKATMLRRGLKAFSQAVTANQMSRAVKRPLREGLKALEANADRQDRQRASIPSRLLSILNRGMRLPYRSKDMQAAANEATRMLQQDGLPPLKPIEQLHPQPSTPPANSSDSESSEGRSTSGSTTHDREVQTLQSGNMFEDSEVSLPIGKKRPPEILIDDED